MTRTRSAPDLDLVQQLRVRVQQMQNSGARRPMPTHPALAGLVQLYPGSSYRTDSASLAMALLAGPSAHGDWTAVVGVDDFGLEAAAALGVDLARTLLVPHPGEHWAEVTAALLDVTSILLLRPPTRVDGHTASRIGARLRKRSAALVVQGAWPQCEAHLSLEHQEWTGLGQGDGHLRTRRAVLAVRRGAGPGVRATVGLPSLDSALLTETSTAIREVG